MGGLSIVVLDVGVQAAASGGQHRWHQWKLGELREPAHPRECGASTLGVCPVCRQLPRSNFGLTKALVLRLQWFGTTQGELCAVF